MPHGSAPRVLRITVAPPVVPHTPKLQSRKQKTKPIRTSTPAPLDVVELLELILLRLPPEVLLTTAQRVCKRWHSVICSSRRIQRTLYLLPIEDSKPRSIGTKRGYVPNPLLARAFSPYLWFDKWTESTRNGKVEHVDIALKMTSQEYPASIRYGGATWRRMLVTQPPIAEVIVTDRRVAPYYDDYFVEGAHNTSGVTMGDLLALDEK